MITLGSLVLAISSTDFWDKLAQGIAMKSKTHRKFHQHIRNFSSERFCWKPFMPTLSLKPYRRPQIFLKKETLELHVSFLAHWQRIATSCFLNSRAFLLALAQWMLLCLLWQWKRSNVLHFCVDLCWSVRGSALLSQNHVTSLSQSVLIIKQCPLPWVINVIKPRKCRALRTQPVFSLTIISLCFITTILCTPYEQPNVCLLSAVILSILYSSPFFSL